MRKAIIIGALVVILPFIQVIMSQPSKYEGKIVKKIEFEGLSNVAEEDLLFVMKTTMGYPLRAREVRNDIKKIVEKGKLSNVEIEIDEFEDGVRLKFKCTERPIIKDIEFKGHDKVPETELTQTVTVKEGDILRKDFLENSVKLIKEKYVSEGLFNSVVSYRVIPIKKDEKSVKVQFIIDEGEEIKIKKISILGAKNIYVKELKKVMETKEDGLFKDGAFKSEDYEEDKAKIIAYYRQEGYLDAEIIEDRVEYQWENPNKKDKRCIFITIKIREGEKYYFDKYTLNIIPEKDKPVFTPSQVKENFELRKSGEVFNHTKFQKDRQAISFNYASKGYIFARVIPDQRTTERVVQVKGKAEKRKFVAIDFTIDEGSQAYIDTIIIKGNKKTKDRVIRREIVIKEGELFDSRKMQVSREKVYNLGYFKEVNIDVRPGSREGYMNLIVDVEEQPTGTISLGGGYGTSSGFSIFADVGEKNLFGNGQQVNVKFEYGPDRSSITLSFYDRWLLNYPIGISTSVNYSLYNLRTSTTIFPNFADEAEYKKESLGYSLGLSYRFLYYYSVGFSWSHAFSRLKDSTGNIAEEIKLSEKLGFQEKRTIGVFAYHDNIDNYLNPTSGFKLGVSVGFTGGNMLGGDDHYVKVDPDFELYYSPFHLPFLKEYPVVFQFRANGTFLASPINRGRLSSRKNYFANPWIEPEDRLFLGGPETIRGWDLYDSQFPQSWGDVGLFHRLMYGAEMRFPIHPRLLWFAAFFDAGALYSDRYWERKLALSQTTALNTYSTYQNNTYLYILAFDRASNDLYTIDKFFRHNMLSYFRYSYGFGFRVQIPMMPLRFWFGKKLVFERGKFRGKGGLKFQFSIGDIRF